VKRSGFKRKDTWKPLGRGKGFLKRGKRLTAVGKSSRAAERTRWATELKMWFATLGIDNCELRFTGCVGRLGLALAHSKKRRFIYDRETFFEVIAACVKCHERLDNDMSHEDMELTVKRIIENRSS